MAKKKSHEEEIRKGTMALRDRGVAVDGVSPEEVPHLTEHLGQAREIDLAIVFALGKITDSVAVEALAAIDRQTADKELKKEIRRSYFKLMQRGFAVPQDERADAKSPVFFHEPPPEIEAYMSPVDGSGGRLLWIVKPHPGHGLQAIQAMVNDRQGLQRVGGAQIRRKELRNMMRGIREQHGVTMIAVPWAYADAVLYAGFEKAKALGRTGLENFHELRAIVNAGTPQTQDHPVYSRLNGEEAQQGAWRELSRRLLEEPELRFWIVDNDWLEPFLPQLLEAQTSRLVLNPLQKEERVASIVRDAVKALCTGEVGRVMQQRMEDMALYFFETSKAELARLALAVALQIKEGEPGPLDIAFLTGLVQKSFAFYQSQQKSKAGEEPSFIVRP